MPYEFWIQRPYDFFIWASEKNNFRSLGKHIHRTFVIFILFFLWVSIICSLDAFDCTDCVRVLFPLSRVHEGEEYHDKEPDRNGEGRRVEVQGKDSYEDSSVKRTERNEERSDPDRRDYDGRRSDYDDRRRDYDDRRSDYDDRRERYDDDRRYQDRRRDDNRYDDRDRDRPPVPNSKPTRRDYHD